MKDWKWILVIVAIFAICMIVYTPSVRTTSAAVSLPEDKVGESNSASDNSYPKPSPFAAPVPVPRKTRTVVRPQADDDSGR